MIKYALACEQAHEFESWFPSSEAFETQRKRGFVTCPFCNSAKIEKQIMAPSVARTDKVPMTPAPEAQPVAVLSEREQELRAALRALREHVLKNAEDVGKGFVEEARKMHYGETEERSIYGKADLAEAQALLEEGIDVLPLPIVPDDRN
ncbi:DUF1178 family protein [Microvirga sp. 3-52]|jgi:hypothetical protein|uniref:DUF1178 family protein n=1 Tax=Microvirga sp. 3-52 TaxID=2792425 RepID=UPI001AD25AF6|nr:DUF1178 family protein [Microvirga sp. 3-52]MBO1907157.1 DUF1178 family protein [Microvirga sp. 3-52]MBS7452118.1 DUF1178 family protein [Microvirga sp. 3-52]